MKLIKHGDVFTVELDGSDRLEKGIVDYIASQFGLTNTAGGNGSEHQWSGLEYQWDGTKLRIKNQDGTWGEWVNLRGEMGEMGFDGTNGNDGWDGQDGIDGDIPEHEWDGTKLRFRQPSGQWGQFVEFGDVIMRSQQFFDVPNGDSLSPQHKLYRQTKVSKWEPVKMSNRYSEGALFFRTIGEKVLNIRGTTKAALTLWAGAEVGVISRRDAGIIHYGIEPKSLAEVHQLICSDRSPTKRLVIDSKHKIRCLDGVKEGETLFIDVLVGR